MWAVTYHYIINRAFCYKIHVVKAYYNFACHAYCILRMFTVYYVHRPMSKCYIINMAMIAAQLGFKNFLQRCMVYFTKTNHFIYKSFHKT